LRRRLSLLVLFGILFGASYSARAQTEITLLVPSPMGRETMPQIVSGFESKTGNKVKITFAVGSRDVEPYGTKQMVAHGQTSDVSIMFAPFPEALASGNVDPRSATTLARLVLGISVRKGAPKPDISSAAALKRALLAAKAISIIDPTQGTLGHQATEVLEKLGITEEIKPKIKLGGASRVANGEAEIFIGPEVSDRIQDGIELVGPAPRDVATPVEIVGFISTHAKDPKLAAALLQFLKSPEAEAAYKAEGLLPVQ
jgi:molybdate transport system substrate-binding protein